MPVELNSDKPEVKLHTCLYQPEIQRRGQQVTLTLKIQIKKLDHKRILVAPDGHDLFMPENSDPKDHIVQAIGQAYHWLELIENECLKYYELAQRIKCQRKPDSQESTSHAIESGDSQVGIDRGIVIAGDATPTLQSCTASGLGSAASVLGL